MHRLGYGAMRLTGEGILGPPKDRTTALGSSYAVLWSWASHWNHFSNFLAHAENGIQSDPPEWLDTVNVPYGNGTVDLIYGLYRPPHKRHVAIPLSSAES